MANEAKVISRTSFFVTVAVAVVAVVAFQYSMKNDIAAASRAATEAGELARAAIVKADTVSLSVNGLGLSLARIEETLLWIRKALDDYKAKFERVSNGREHALPGR